MAEPKLSDVIEYAIQVANDPTPLSERLLPDLVDMYDIQVDLVEYFAAHGDPAMVDKMDSLRFAIWAELKFRETP